jgi:hypothetical protein
MKSIMISNRIRILLDYWHSWIHILIVLLRNWRRWIIRGRRRVSRRWLMGFISFMLGVCIGGILGPGSLEVRV